MIGGLVSATLLTLIVLPALYVVLESRDSDRADDLTPPAGNEA
jgi:Cu/Ag efflux pump CusA